MNQTDVPGLSYLSNFITTEEQTCLLTMIDQQPWITDLKRRVQHYGYRYDYKSRSVDPSMRLGTLPDWLKSVAERLHREQWVTQVPDQVILNEYVSGQGISRHIDCLPCFGDTILSLSLGTPCVMIFSDTQSDSEVPILLEPCSLVVMQREARNLWKHGIVPRKVDVFEGQRIQRGRRVSLTFRKVTI